MVRKIVLLSLLLLLAGCQSMVNGYVDEYMDGLEEQCVLDAKKAASEVGIPLDLYAELWDQDQPYARRLKVAGTLIADMVRRSVAPESIAHVSLSVGVMLARSHRSD